jgi:hypothetical protein
MNPSSFFDLMPTFKGGLATIRDQLCLVALILAFAGLVIHTFAALVRKNIAHMFPTLVRLALVAITITFIGPWGDMFVSAVNGWIADLGVSGATSNIFVDYQAAIARKMGTAAAANNFAQPSNQGTPTVASNFRGGGGGNATGALLTHYAYPGDNGGTPGGKIDSDSARGIGAFPFSSAPGSLIPGYSAALTDSAAAAYGIQPGQQFTITTTGGQTYNLVYADRAPESDQRVDIYDPQGQLPGGNNFSASIASINGGPVVLEQSGLASIMPNPGGSIGDQLMWAFTLGLSWIASAIMWLMQVAQQILYLIEIAVAPVFVAMLMIPALTHLARQFFMTIVAVCLWPFAWAVCDLVSKLLIDIAVNPAGSVAGAIGAAASLVTGPLAGMAYLLVVAVWVIGSTIAARSLSRRF